MPDEIRITKFQLSEKDQLLSFVREVFPDKPRMSDERFWSWHFLENPYVTLDDPPIWVAKMGDEIVGQVAGIPVEVKVGAETKSGVWLLDFVAHPKTRGRGLGKKLLNTAKSQYDIGMGMVTDEQVTRNLCRSIGWYVDTRLSRYSKLLFPGNALREISRNSFLRRTANLLFAPARSRFKNLSISDNGNLRYIKKFDSDLDKLWQAASAQWPCAIVRNSKMLEWQFSKQPGKKFEIIGYYQNDQLLGYIILFFRKKDSKGILAKATIADICYNPDQAIETIDSLLQAALELAVEREAGSLVTDVSDRLMQERLKRFGFWRVKNPLVLLIKSEENEDLLYNSDKWFLTRGDSDVSIYEDPNL